MERPGLPLHAIFKRGRLLSESKGILSLAVAARLGCDVACARAGGLQAFYVVMLTHRCLDSRPCIYISP